VLHLYHDTRKPVVRQNDPLLAATKSSGRIEALEGFRELKAALASGEIAAARPSVYS
jgi:hypothetical protein